MAIKGKRKVFLAVAGVLATMCLAAPRAEAFTVESLESPEHNSRSARPGAPVYHREIRMYYLPYEQRVREPGSLLERARRDAGMGGRERISGISRTGTQPKKYYGAASPSLARRADSAERVSKKPAQSGRRAHILTGIASWYGRKFHGRRTASGEVYNMHARTAAHRSLPFGTLVRVTNLQNGRQSIVRINDRGPFVAGREIDLSYGTASDLGMVGTGLAKVRMEILSQ